MTDYRLADAKELVRLGFLALFEETFESASGEQVRRWTVDHPGVVAAVPLVDGPDGLAALLVRQFRPALRRSVLEIPAGKLDVPGEDPDAAMIRELAEEIRHRPGRLVKVAEVFNAPDFCNQRTHVYLALDLEPCDTPGPVLHEERDMTIQRVALTDVPSLIAAGELADARTIIGLLLAERALPSTTTR
jgi:ADP-ribose pyrophosphatase